jgi:hypothetical protein
VDGDELTVVQGLSLRGQAEDRLDARAAPPRPPGWTKPLTR